MAATVEASRLTEAHRLAQARLGADTVRQVVALWPLLDPTRLDATAPDWLRLMLTVLSSQRSASARLAANYLTVFRGLELGALGEFVPTLADVLDDQATRVSLMVTGPVAVKSAMSRGAALEIAAEVASARVAAAAMRHVLDGGRQTIVDTVRSDRQALGFARAASGNACSFCAMLAGRGPVYGEDTAGFEAHDGCSCGVEPVYRENAAWPAGSERYAQIWRETTQGLSGKDARNAFRTALAGD